MITLSEVVTAIKEHLNLVFPDVPIQSNNTSEGDSQPSLFVDFESIKLAAYGTRGQERTLQVVVHYFPTDDQKNHIEQLIEVQEKLEKAFFGHFEIMAGFVVPPFEVTSTKVDGVLQCRFQLYYLEIDNTETGEDITELHLNMEKRD